MKRFVAILLAVLCALPLLAATPEIIAEPSVMLFPFQVSGDADRAAGSRIALLIGNRIPELHNLRVKPAPPGIERSQYLKTARDAGADYYVSGYVTPLGDEVSLVEQVVSTQSGIIVYSGTAQLRTYGESVAQGDIVDDAIVRHALRDIGTYTPKSVAQNVPTPVPTASASQADIGRLLRNRRSRGRATPSPSPSPASTSSPIAATVTPTIPTVPARPGVQSPAPVSAPVVSLPTVPPGTTGAGRSIAAAPARPAIALGTIGGVSDATNRAYAADLLRRDLARRSAVVALASDPTQTCDADHAAAIASGILSTKTTHDGIPVATFELTVVQCDGGTAFRRTFVRSAAAAAGVHGAIQLVIDAAANDYLARPG